MLQRVRVVLAPNPELERADAAQIPAQPPPLSAARAVRGEILRDEAGRYYEKIGNFVRELGALGASADGDLLEVPPTAESHKKEEPSRKMFPDPGQYRVLRWGEFKALLAGQIAHPQRLRDEHRLPCYVQVVESGIRQPVQELAKTLFGDSAIAHELLMLSAGAAERLQLKDLIPQNQPEGTATRERGLVLPGDRLFRLKVAIDPTANEPAPEPQPRKKAIPERFASLPARRPREEVLEQMRTPSGFTHRLAGLRRSLFAQAEFSKWQRALWGKDYDEQLWGIAPPAGMIEDPAVREWASATLELAGYDLGSMLREWEIYWRRKA
jgi:hypothetical protein